MAIADFNKDNPFVIIIRKLDDELYEKSIEITKYISLYILVSPVVTGVATLVMRDLLLLVYTLISIIYIIIRWNNILSKSEFSNVNKLIYGEEFSAIVVNNEKLFEIIQSMNIAKGELISFHNNMLYSIVIWLIVLLYSIITKFI